MKTELTKEQSQHLIELGVSKYDADWKVIGIDVDHSLPLETLIEKSQVEPHFTLESLLRIVPKEIIRYNLTIWWDNYAIDWNIGYHGKTDSYQSASELIDAVYELVCWCVISGYL